MTSAWPATEAAIHRWVRESTGIPATSCYWPSRGMIQPEPPCCEMKVVGGRQTGAPGVRSSQTTAQPVEWLATITAALGTHGVQLWTDSGATPDVDSEVVIVNPATTIAQARNALLADLSPLLPVTITATASGTDSIAIAGTLVTDVFSMGSTATVDLTLVSGPYSAVRYTRVVSVLMLDFRATPTSGAGCARDLANRARNGIGDYRNLIRRTGWHIGATVGDRPGYEDDASESRYVLEFEFLGHEADYAIPRPWVRRAPLGTATVSGSTASFGHP